MSTSEMIKLVINGNEIEVDTTTVFDKTVEYTPTETEMESLIDEGTELLGKYFPDNEVTRNGMETIFREYFRNKGWLINAFQKMPGYNGKYQVVISGANYNRPIDREKAAVALSKIASWAYHHDTKTERYFCYRALKSILAFISENENPTVIDDELANAINYFAKDNSINVPVREGMKITKIIDKIAKVGDLKEWVELHEEHWMDAVNGIPHSITKDYGWNKQRAEFGDSMSPIVSKVTAVLSCNPIDYWTMSFGEKWASCHTIDKLNLRGHQGRGGNQTYTGAYCGGTESYMLDTSSFMLYYISDSYSGNYPELEDKKKRCMFYIGEDKIVQSRVYPDGRDGGEASIAKDMRTLVQKLFADAYNVTNMWSLSKGTYECGEVITSEGPHYRDYNCYEDCNVSYLKRFGDWKNKWMIYVGHDPICPNCGRYHSEEDNIFCEDCAKGNPHCCDCGREIDPDYDTYYHNEYSDEWYCEDCCEVCTRCGETGLELNHVSDGCACDYCLDRYYTWSDWSEEYIPDSDSVTTEEGNTYPDDDGPWAACTRCGEPHDIDHMITHDGNYYCEDCGEEFADIDVTEEWEEWE